MDRGYLHDRLKQIQQETAGARSASPAGWWEGDRAGKLQVVDDIRSGRVTWRAAYCASTNGLKAVEERDFGRAELYLRQAEGYLLASVKAQMNPANYQDLISSAQRRGRPRATGERDQRYLEAFEKEKSKGLSDPIARKAALKADSELAAAFNGKTDRALRNAINAALSAKKLEVK